MKKTLTTIAVFAFSAVMAMAQDKPAAAPAQEQSKDPIVIAAGNLTVRQSEFEAALKTLPAEYQQYALGAGKKQFAEDYLRMRMLAAQGMKNNLDKDPEVISQLDLMRENLVANAQLGRLEKSITVSDEDLRKAYEANKNQYEQVKARHILIAFKGSPAAQAGKKELTEDEAKAKAEGLRKQIAAGTSFEELAKKESDDTSSGAKGGDLGAFSRGQMVEEFEKAAFDSKVGEVSAPVRTQYGYHLIQVKEHTTTSFETAKPALEKQLRQQKMQETLEAMKNDAHATFNEAYFAPPPPPPSAKPAKMDAPPTPAGNAKATAAKPGDKKPAEKKPAEKKKN